MDRNRPGPRRGVARSKSIDTSSTTVKGIRPRRRPARRNSFSSGQIQEEPSDNNHNPYFRRQSSNDGSDDDSNHGSDSGHGRKNHHLKDYFNSNQRKAKGSKFVRRDSGGGSVASETSMSIDIFNAATPHAERRKQNLNNSNDLSVVMKMHQSSMTLPITNVVKTESDLQHKKKMKTEQIIESLVWFSFHTPRVVLEDLISHELALWRREQKKIDLSTSKSRSEEVSVSSLSHSEDPPPKVLDGDFAEKLIRLQNMTKGNDFMKLPKSVDRESALLFVDMSGFTKLSTMLDAESLSKVINAYFDMIVSEVLQHGGDILKFAGDAFFAEWTVSETNMDSSDDDREANNALEHLTASLASVSDLGWDDNDDIPKLSNSVLMATKCAISIVRKYSDYHVTSASNNTGSAMLNVHCGVGVGSIVGLHLGDYREDQEDDAVEMRREFLVLGDPIEQVSKAADLATDGEVYASPEALLSLALCCQLTEEQSISNNPVLIASKNECFLQFEPEVHASMSGDGVPAAMQPYESLRMHCKSLDHTALARLHLQMALYVHPVIRGDELALSAAIQDGKISQPTETLESRHRAEAELRSVFTMFIKAVISPRITGMFEIDKNLYKTLADIMHVTSRELDRYSGHLRQFIVDDKGVVLIATFGLRGSTFPNMVANNALPAVFAIHRALKIELGVENRIGATFGKVYCGVVGGVRRHEFAVMGAPVNLAARLMASKENSGILVDESVRTLAGNRFTFKNLPPVQAKGYNKPVPILEPLSAVANKKKKSSYPFAGRTEEKRSILEAADAMLSNQEDSKSSVVFLMGESGTGKSALCLHIIEEIGKERPEDDSKIIVAARSTSTETEQRIPLSSYRQVFLKMIRDHCAYDGGLSLSDFSCNRSISSKGSSVGLSLRTMRSLSKRRRFSGMSGRNIDASDESDTPGSARSRPSLVRARAVRGDVDINDNSSHTSTDASSLITRREWSSPASGLYAPGSLANMRYLPGGLSLGPSIHGPNRSVHEHKRTPRPGTGFDQLSSSLHRGRTNGRGDHLASSLHRDKPGNQGPSPHRRPSSKGGPSPILKAQSARNLYLKPHSSKQGDKQLGEDSSIGSIDQQQNESAPYFEKLCWICEQLDYPYEYADIVGSQFLGLENATPVTHVDGHVPTMDELVEFLALAFIKISEFADLKIVVLDDFQWVDAFSWKIFRVLCKRGKDMLLICATRSHDKQALRRLSTAFTSETQLDTNMIEVSLGPLEFSDIRDLAASVLEVDRSSVTDDLCAHFFQQTGGLPVFVLQALENTKRKKTLKLVEGTLEWTEEGLKQKQSTPCFNSNAFMEETFLSRFDALDIRIRKVLHSCAVLGLSFALTDVIQVHPEISERDIEKALDTAVDEMILLEQVDDNEEATLGSTYATGDDETNNHASSSRSSDDPWGIDDRFFQFSHAMWRNNVLKTMLQERKRELHRSIAESMERNLALDLEEVDIAKLLTLFDHWKSCGDFSKAAPLALAVGARLEEWDLSAQSLDLYEDALELSFDSVFKSSEKDGGEEWIQVKAKPMVLDLILRLHICIGLCHQRLGDPLESALFFEDAFNIIKSSSKVPGMSRSLMIPIISSLCVLKLDQDPDSSQVKQEQDDLLGEFVKEANRNGHPVHISRALALQAMHKVRLGLFDEAIRCAEEITSVYDIEDHHVDMTVEYGSDFALAALSDCTQWLYLSGREKEAEEQADMIIDDFLPALDDSADLDDVMFAIFPLIQVLILVDRAKDADWLLKKYIINPYNDTGMSFWSPLFNPLAYLLELILMEEKEEYDPKFLEDLEDWVLDEESAQFDIDLERKGHILMGEICWRLAYIKNDNSPSRPVLLEKARDLLNPIATYPHTEVFLKHTAEALLQSL